MADTYRYFDLSHTIENDLITIKGMPAPIICDYLTRADSRAISAEGTEFQIGKIEMVTNTGTYIDCPFHRYVEGKDLSEMAIERFVDLDGVVVSVDHRQTLAIDAACFHDIDVQGRAVLVHTGWDAFWSTPAYQTGHPYLTKDAAVYLRDSGAALVGIDSHNIDDTRDQSRPVHTVLLGAEVLICEHLCCLETLPAVDFQFSAVPPKFKGVGTFPVRAMARIVR